MRKIPEERAHVGSDKKESRRDFLPQSNQMGVGLILCPTFCAGIATSATPRKLLLEPTDVKTITQGLV